MSSPDDARFSGAIPRFYEKHMVPMLFAPYADDLVARVAPKAGKRLLELAAGTGVVTRAMAARLPPDVAIVATDLNQPMIDFAASVGTARPVEWRAADAMQLPFGDAELDTVVCQFGVMFFSDKPKAFAEIRRVLSPKGMFFFNAWDRIQANQFADEVERTLGGLFPSDPPRFMQRTPHGYHDASRIRADLRAGGFTAEPELTIVSAVSVAESARAAAEAYCAGTPLRGEIESRGSGLTIEAVVGKVEEALARRFGPGRIEGSIRAHVVSVQN